MTSDYSKRRATPPPPSRNKESYAVFAVVAIAFSDPLQDRQGQIPTLHLKKEEKTVAGSEVSGGLGVDRYRFVP
jgi:hypothetical protein